MRLLLLAIFLVLAATSSARSQVAPMQCDDNVNRARIQIEPNGNFRLFQGPGVLYGFARLQGVGPFQLILSLNGAPAPILGVNRVGELVQLGPFPRPVGRCIAMAPPILPFPGPTVVVPNYQRPVPGKYYVMDPNRRIPQGMINSSSRFSIINYGMLKVASGCESVAQSKGERAFIQCFLNRSYTKPAKLVSDCHKNANDGEFKFAYCVVSGGKQPSNKGIVGRAKACRDIYGNKAKAVAYCMLPAKDNSREARLRDCAAKQQAEDDEVTFWGVVGCAARKEAKLTPEQTIVADCLMSTGGEPATMAQCTGGKLLKRELQKCLTNGFGGQDGCYGENNSWQQAAKKADDLLRRNLGNGEVAKAYRTAFRYMSFGPPPNDPTFKAANDALNTLNRAQQTINDIPGAGPAISQVFGGVKW